MSRKVFSAVLVVFFIFMGGLSVSAESNHSMSKKELLELKAEVEKVMNEELGVQIQTSDSDVSVGVENTTVELKESTLEQYDYDKETIVNAFKEEAKALKEGFSNAEVEIKKNELKETDNNGLQSVIDNGSYYTAKVWTGIPAMGWGYINQDFTGRNESSD